MKPLAIAALLSIVAGCGGRFAEDSDAATDSGASDGGVADAGADVSGWTNCQAPSGVGICGGPNNCGAQCQNCYPIFEDAGELRPCDDVNYYFAPDSSVDTYVCPDGALNACTEDENAPACWDDTCTTADLPKLWLLNGRADLARYADRSSYTGATLPPTPTACPTVSSGLQLCGGACGSCGATQVCTGRSPSHPYSLCVNAEPDSFPCARGSAGSCNTIHDGYMCLTFQVDTASQSIADQASLCVPSTLCQAAAASYPGGAFCTSGS
jgi:hypothetical protein